MENQSISEIRLFVMFHELDRLIYLLQSRQASGLIPDTSSKHVQAVLKDLGRKRDWALSQLPLCGVEPFKASGNSITEEYRSWFKWWKDFLYSLSEEERLKIVEGADSDKRPAGTWRDFVS